MTVYLNVFDSFSGKQIGVLEMRSNVMGGTTIQTYEFVGSGASDGGIWEWISGASGVEAHLTSNLRKSKIAVMTSGRWGAINPPNEPWFKADAGSGSDRMTYFDHNGKSHTMDWFVKT